MHSPTLRSTVCGSFALRPLFVVMLAALACQAEAQAGDIFIGLGSLNTGSIHPAHDSSAFDVSADGSVAVGYSYNNLGQNEAFRWAGGTMTGLGFLDTGTRTYSEAYGVSADGNVVVGRSQNGFGNGEAFRWKDGTMTGLGFLGTGTGSWAIDVSADGRVVVGYSENSLERIEAFRWIGGTMTGLGFLGTGTFSQATGVSADGSVVVGQSQNNLGSEAFRWTGGTMTGLGFLGTGTGSMATGVSADGSVVVGYSVNSLGSGEAFRWTGGTMTGLGFLNTGEFHSGYFSNARGVSADGRVVVGQSQNNSGLNEAFRWTQATNMQSVAQWLAGAGVALPPDWFLNDATGVNGNGNVVVGIGTKPENPTGSSQAWLARVGPEGSGLLTDIPAFNNTLIEAGSRGVQAGAGLVSLVMSGAHHRSLLDSGLARTQKGTCAWATTDAAHNDQTNTTMELVEAGACKDINSARIGLGIGTAHAQQDWPLGGNARYNGPYLIAEFANAFTNRMEISITGYYGGFDTNLERNYRNGANVDSSTGKPDATATALRARFDWKDVVHLGQFGLSPYAAYTWSVTKLDAYTEIGGGFPSQFAPATWDTNDLRLGIAAKTVLSAITDLRLGIEAVHRFEESTSGVNGQVIGLGIFSLPGQHMTQTWARAMVDLDYRLSNTFALTFGASAASRGGDADWGLTAGLRASF